MGKRVPFKKDLTIYNALERNILLFQGALGGGGLMLPFGITIYCKIQLVVTEICDIIFYFRGQITT
jgi:hypothetical protein